MALPNSIEQSADARLSGANETAQVFRLLNAHGSEFTPEESDAYNKLRDAVMGISGESPDTYMKTLAKYLDVTPNTQAPEVLPTPINENLAPEPLVVAQEVAAAPVAEVPDIQEIPAPSFMSRDRSGMQFGAADTDAEPASEPAVAPVEAKIDVVSEVLAVEADPAPLSVPSVPEIAAMPEEVVPVSAPSVERPANIEEAAKEIEAINTALNEFSGWHALAWINDPKTGYREYMKKLIAARGEVAKARRGEGTSDLAALTLELRAKAEGVRNAVKGETPQAAASVAETAPATPASAVHEAPAVVMPETPAVAPMPAEPVSLKVETATPRSESTAWAHKTEEPQPAPGVENIAAAIEEVPSAIPDAQALNIHELPRINVMPGAEQVMTVPPPIPEVAQPAPEVPSEAPAEVDLTTLSEPGATDVASVMQEQAAAPLMTAEAPAPNPEIYSPKVEEELNSLLTKWLGHDGWILKKSGTEHPDWHKMAPLTVGEVIDAAQKGENRPGLQATMISNLADNLKKWGELYGISMLQHEDTTIDEMMHRVVFEYLKP